MGLNESLGFYIAMTHPQKPDQYRVSEDGTKLYMMERGLMVCLEGEDLDKMTPAELYAWHLPKLREWKQENRV